jgi:FAD/FMN-containing dehydrogenase
MAQQESERALTDIIAQLRAILDHDAVLVGDAVAARATSWINPAPLRAAAIIRPYSTEQVAEVLRLCQAAGQPIVPHGGCTNLVQATRTAPGDFVLSLERMHAIESIDVAGRTLTVQAGAPLQKVQEAAAAAGLLFPLDLAARGSATIGGCAAMNAGGVRVLRYGVMRDLVLGLETVLPDGTILSSLNRMLKNNAGYDLKQLFIGSEGTLGIITRLVLRLLSGPQSVNTALIGLGSFDQVVALLDLMQRQLGGTLASFEVMWNEYYRLTTTPPASSKPPLHQDHAFYVLAETLGAEPDLDRTEFEWALEHGHKRGIFADAVLANNAQQRNQLWYLREDSEQIERQHHLTFGFDVSLPIAAMQAYVDTVRAQLVEHFGAAVRCWVYGHLADGNLHINVWAPAIRPADCDVVETIVYTPLRTCGGSISAEHGIGVDKKAYLAWSRTPAEIELMKRLKRMLDPKLILNPGKVFDAVGA